MSADLDDPRPMYVRVADGLRDAIERGEYQVGDRLPSYAELGRQYAVSHMTVKQAIETLKRDQTVVGRQGMGVFVRGAAVRREVGQPQVDELRTRVGALESRIDEIEAELSRLRK